MKTVELSILRDNKLENICTKGYRLYYGLAGQARTSDGNMLKKGDAIVYNPDEVHSLDCRKCVVACFDIHYSEVLRLTDYRRKMILCNTCLNKNENSKALGKVIEALIRARYEGSYANLLFEKHALDLVFLLVVNYSNNAISSGDTRKEEIEAYIEAHYFEDLSLPEISDVFGVTPPYFSKYFKELFGTTFLKYLNGIRMQYACEELVKSDGTILRIALNHGFPNAASFSREFKNMYSMTPNEYRSQNQRNRKEEEDGDVIGLLENHIEEENQNIQTVEINAEELLGELDRYWTSIVNLSGFTTVAKSGVMEQIDLLLKGIGFGKARVLLDTYDENGRHNFFVADKVMDFFIVRHMDVMIVLDYRMAGNRAQYLAYLKEQCLRFCRRFGDGVRERCTFEVLYDTEFDRIKLKEYKAFCNDVRQILRECRFKDMVIGPGMMVNESGDNLRRFVKEAEVDAVTISAAPFSVQRKDGDVYINRLTDSGYVKELYNTAQRILKEEGKEKEIWIIGWKDSLNDVDVLHDTSYIGARILRNVLDGYGLYKSLPMMKPLDLMFDEMVYGKTFNGLPGLMTSKGILKPGYYALKFLDRQDRYLSKVSENYLVTRSRDNGFFQIVCHNCKKLGYRYYLNETVEEYSDELFEDTEDKTFRFCFHQIPEGKYLLKKRMVSDEAGTAYMGYVGLKYTDDSYMGMGERRFLEACAEPRMSGEVLRVGKDGNLVIECVLKKNAFVHLHVLRMMD